MALAILVRGRRDREARDVRERIELLLGDRDFRVQAAAIEALAVIGDPASIAALRRMIDRELDGRLKRRGKEVARDLETGASAGEDLRRMRDELGELRSVASTLRERIEKLEATNGDPGRGKTPDKATTKAKAKDKDKDKPNGKARSAKHKKKGR
jgi:aminopeptidase N